LEQKDFDSRLLGAAVGDRGLAWLTGGEPGLNPGREIKNLTVNKKFKERI